MSVLAVVAAFATAALAGCGLGAGRAPTGLRLTVTSDFGARVLKDTAAPRVAGQETVMRVLLRNDRVGTRYGGGFVQSIDGLAGGQENGQPVDWFYFVNGIEAAKGAAETNVHAGDRIWWDRHDWAATAQVPAVVGSFPEPFRSGDGGKRLPVRVDCTAPGGLACKTVAARLGAAGVAAPMGTLGTYEPQTLTVLVGPWAAVRADPAAATLAHGPRASGVFARFSSDGGQLELLDQHGAAARRLGAAAGLVAATRYAGAEPTWLVTGTDAAGVNAAARALVAATLRNRFAVALSAGTALSLPLAGP